METMTVGFNGNEKGVHGSDEIEFKVAPYEVTPPWDLIEWWNSLLLWQKLLILATGIVSVAGATYVVTKRK